MKTLMKISLCFVMGLFMSMSVSAQLLSTTHPNYPGNDNLDGSVTLTVAEYINFKVMNGDILFKYDFSGNTSNVLLAQSQVEIRANVDWDLQVYTLATELDGPGTETLPLSHITCSVDAGGTIPIELGAINTNSRSSVEGTHLLNKNWNIFWVLDESSLGDPVPGDYTCDIIYSIAKL